MGHGSYPVLSRNPTSVNDATPLSTVGGIYSYKHATYGWQKYMYVYISNAVAVTAGMSLCFTAGGKGYVSPDRAGGASTAGFGFAGVAVCAITAGQYGFIVCGFGDIVEVLTDGAVAGAGETLVPHATADGQADGNAHSTVEERVFGYSLEADDASSLADAVLCKGV